MTRCLAHLLLLLSLLLFREQADAQAPQCRTLAVGTSSPECASYAALAQSAPPPWVVAGGTADAITATYSPAITLTDGQLAFFRATAANATTTPTFAPNGLAAHTITKDGGTALVAGDIPGNLAEVILRYNLANTRWELLNPGASPTSVPWVVAGGTADAITATYSPAITLTDGQLAFFRATAANATTTPTFAPNGLTAHTITKKGGVALAASDIPGNLSEIILRYNLANTRWELLNPAAGASSTGTINSQSSYTIATSDCGNVVIEATGSLGLFSLPAASGFSSGCVITLTNKSTTRAQELDSGWPDPRNPGSNYSGGSSFCGSSCLWPQQTIRVVSNGSNWDLLSLSPYRYLFPNTGANPTLFVACSNGVNGGNCSNPLSCADTNDGLSTSAPLCTIQQALNMISANFDAQGVNYHIALNPGPSGNNSYTGGFIIAGQNAERGDGVSICGGTWTAASSCSFPNNGCAATQTCSPNPLLTRITCSSCSSAQAAAVFDTGVMFLTNLTVGANQSGGVAVFAYQNATAELNNVTVAATQLYDFEADYGGHMNLDTNITIANASAHTAVLYSKGANASILTYDNSNVIVCTLGLTVNAGTNPAFAKVERQGLVAVNSQSWSGCTSGATGPRYYGDGLGLLYTGTAGANANYFPGSSVGTVSGGAVYD